MRCVQKSGTGIEYDVDGSLCAGARPSDTEGCNKDPCPAEWIAQPFGEVRVSVLFFKSIDISRIESSLTF